jgi:hypothetical protein
VATFRHEINFLRRAQKRPQYFWSETTQHYVENLKPDAKIALPTCVCFHRSGVYNLNRYKFSIKDEHRKSFHQQIYSPFQHIIIVEDKNQTNTPPNNDSLAPTSLGSSLLSSSNFGGSLSKDL